MTLEVATYIADLQPVNPPSTDQVSQGDDHLRLIKQVLQNTFTGGNRAFNIPGTFAFSTTTTLTKANGEGTVYCSTAGGAVTFTLPTLVALDAGWKIHFIKTSSDVNPMFIKAGAGNINSGGIGALAQARRAIPGVRITVIWDGTNWFITRALALPIGSMIAFFGITAPAGFEWPNGQTLSSSANYPEFNSVTGGLTTPDLRGRTEITLDNLGGVAAGRLPGGVITGSTLGAVGGVDTVTLALTQIPAHTHPNTISVSDTGHSHSYDPFRGGVAGGNTTSGNLSGGSGTTGTGFANISATITNVAQGGGQSHSNLQPSFMCGKLLVVE